jgi:hypothetical protein
LLENTVLCCGGGSLFDCPFAGGGSVLDCPVVPILIVLNNIHYRDEKLDVVELTLKERPFLTLKHLKTFSKLVRTLYSLRKRDAFEKITELNERIQEVIDNMIKEMRQEEKELKEQRYSMIIERMQRARELKEQRYSSGQWPDVPSAM